MPHAPRLWIRGLIACIVTVAAVTAAPPRAAVEVTLDAASLNALLSNMAPEQVRVKLAGDHAVTLHLEDLRVTGFDPAAADGRGELLTALRLRVPELGLDVPVEPRLSLLFRDDGGGRTCHLRFERAVLDLPLTGALDIAPLLPTLPIVPGAVWVVDAARGRVRVEPRLVDARMGARALRLGFDLDVRPVPATDP